MPRHLLLLLLVFTTASHAQFVALRKMEVPLENVCDNDRVHAMLLFTGQADQKCSLEKAEVEKLLNERVTYHTSNPKFKLEKHESVSTLVNCRGELVLVELDTKSPEFNQQVCDVFRSIGDWKAGTINGNSVDSVHLWGIEIKKGRIVLR